MIRQVGTRRAARDPPFFCDQKTQVLPEFPQTGLILESQGSGGLKFGIARCDETRAMRGWPRSSRVLFRRPRSANWHRAPRVCSRDDADRAPNRLVWLDPCRHRERPASSNAGRGPAMDATPNPYRSLVDVLQRTRQRPASPVLALTPSTCQEKFAVSNALLCPLTSELSKFASLGRPKPQVLPAA
jgi:hypothetical protein